MSAPVLQAGDQIHVAVPIRQEPFALEKLKKDYADQGITIFRISELSIAHIEIISIIRAAPKPTPGQMMSGFRPPSPMPSSAA